MVKIHIGYQGELRCESTHGPSSRTLVTDAPSDNCGKGESFSPTDLVATALGSCMLTIMGIVADREGVALTGTTLEVEKHMIADPKRRIAKLDVHIRCPHDFDAELRAKLERAAVECPVYQSVHPNIEIPVHFDWNQALQSS